MDFPEWPTRQFDLDIEGLHLTMEKINDPELLLNRLLEKDKDHEDLTDERIPYWADLWPSAVGLGRYLAHSGLIRPGAAVTELGCGLGLSGIVAGLLGAEVTFTDYLEEALAFARRNWSLNLSRPARFEKMDWRSPAPQWAADIVLASDVAYEQRAFDYLPNAFQALCRPGGIILVSEPGREMARPFFEKLPDQGFTMRETLVEGIFSGSAYRVRVYALRKLTGEP